MKVKIDLDLLIGQKIVATKQPLTLLDISRATGINMNRLVDYRKNRAIAIKLENIAALCAFFGCTPGDLLVLEE